MCVLFWRLFYIFKKWCRVVKTLPLIKLFSFNRMIFTKPRENQKTKKPKLFRECLVWGSCLFFLVFLEFFWFCFVMTLKKPKKIKVFLGFLDKLMVKELWKSKKIQAFFWFFALIVVTCLLKICPKTKKDLSFFGFSQFFNHRFIQKTKKTLSFLVFSRSWQNKTKKTRGKPKKTNMSLKPNILWKVLVFWFSRGLEGRVSYLTGHGENQRTSRKPKNTFHYRPLVSTISLRKRLSPEYVRQFISNFFLWRPDLCKGLFQREVACKEESSIWANSLSVKQGFF